MQNSFDINEITKALKNRDNKMLLHLGNIDPVQTLVHLDGSMRGLRDGLQPLEQIQWLEKEDLVIRRGLGRKQQDVDLQIIRNAYQGGGLFLVVGAGISQGSGMPGWKKLVLEVLEYSLYHGSPEHYRQKEINLRQFYSKIPPEIAERDIKSALESIHPLSSELREKIQSIRDELVNMDKYDSKILLRATQAVLDHFGPDDFLIYLRNLLYNRELRRSDVFPAIARMVSPKAGQQGPPTPRIFAIVTYNFDDMIEQAIREAGYGFTVKCSKNGELVDNRGDTRDRYSAIDIFHVHGIAPGGWIVDLQGIDLVFTEAQYEVQYGNKSTLTRNLHRSFFTNALGLIIGSSLMDDYAVQQLKGSHISKPGWYNYVVMRLPDEFIGRELHITSEEFEKISALYRDMGLRVIWISNYAEIPEILDRISGKKQ